MSEVSLCIIRVEECQKLSKKQFQHDNRDLICANSLVRGLREVRDIHIETYHHPADITSDVADITNMAQKGEEVGAVALTLSKDTLTFVSGNPFVEITKGIIHLFKENDLTDIKSAAIRSQTVCILAVPSVMTCGDLLSFTAACHSELKHVRIVKGTTPNQYMALLTFRSPQAVEQFYTSFNGIPFNSLEPEWCCHLVFVSKVEILSESEGGGVAPISHTELPTCPVCLERMDESVDGILTIMCNHSFHGNCLGKWGDTSCPVCRYVQTPEPTDESHCLECKATRQSDPESLWICLICGHIGCGRYLHGHAYQHYVDTHHCYSMQLGSNRVWDYVGDNFVHRLLQNEADGKLVEGSGPEKSEKATSQQLEFTYLLTSQLESQRQYYEELLSSSEIRNSKENSLLREKTEGVLEENKVLKKSVETLSKEKAGLEKKMQSVSNKLTQTQKMLKDEKDMNEAMQKNLTVWQKRVSSLQEEFEKLKKSKDEELADIKEQLRDVMFYLEAEKTINSRVDKEEIQQGQIQIGKPPSPNTSKSHRRRKK